jgi:hypothetical protein
MRWRKSKQRTLSPAQRNRRAAGVILWVCAIVAGIVGGEFALPIALALFVGGIFLLVFNPQPKDRR